MIKSNQTGMTRFIRTEIYLILIINNYTLILIIKILHCMICSLPNHIDVSQCTPPPFFEM